MQKWSILKRITLFTLTVAVLYVGVPRIVKKYRSIKADHTFRTTDVSSIAMLQYLPKDYYTNSNKYPVVIFLHGIIEKGWDSTNPLVQMTTIHRVDKEGPPRRVKEGHEFPFILLSPQLKDNYETWPSWYVLEVIEWAKRNLRVDEKRIHLTGLSLGGAGAFCVAEDLAGVLASSAPVCAPWNSPESACQIAKEDVAIWAFHGLHDPQVHFTTTSNMIDAINECDSSQRAKATIYPDLAHNVWDRAYRVDHDYHHPNLYDWIMTIRKTKKGSNMLPFADVGKDDTTSSRTFDLQGSGTDHDGSITGYEWALVEGPGEARFSKTTQAETQCSVTTGGTYWFRLTVTDDGGSTDSDFIRIEVSQ